MKVTQWQTTLYFSLISRQTLVHFIITVKHSYLVLTPRTITIKITILVSIPMDNIVIKDVREKSRTIF